MKTRCKAARYLSAGTAMVWLADPEARSLELHLPGFRATVSELFPD